MARAPLRLSLVLMLLLPAGPATRPQDPAPHPPRAAQVQAPPPRFRAGTTLITVDAIVRDRDGRFVADLTPGDFEVLEDGKAPDDRELLRRQCRKSPRGSRRGRCAPAPRPQRVSPPPPPQVQRVFVLFFDQEHMAAGGFKRAQQAAASFLETNLQAGDIGGVVSGGTMVDNRLTSSREELEAAVRSLQPSADTRSRPARHARMAALPQRVRARRIAEGDRRGPAPGHGSARAWTTRTSASPTPTWSSRLVRNKAGRLVARAAGGRAAHDPAR